MKITTTKEFKSRDELDSYIRINFGEDTAKNKDVILELSDKELTDLSLSESTTVLGTRIKKKN